MLIVDGNLNVEAFKEFFNKLNWVKTPRKLSQDHIDYFYIGSYEDDKKVIKVSVRPSKRMQISESFKNRTVDGEIPNPKASKRGLVNWGSTVTVVVDDKFIQAVKDVSEFRSSEKIQKLSWD